MKLDEITVTFHPHNAKIPDVIITDDKHVIIGIIIHLNCLNIKYKTSIKNMYTRLTFQPSKKSEKTLRRALRPINTFRLVSNF